MNSVEIDDLARRCKFALVHGYTIAGAEDYAKQLGYGGEAPPPKVVKFSAAHLLHLLNNKGSRPLQASAQAVKVSKTKKAAPAPAPDPPLPRKQEDIPTVPVDISAVATMKADVESDKSGES